VADPTNSDEGVISGEIAAPDSPALAPPSTAPGPSVTVISGEDWPARVDELLAEAEQATSIEDRVAVLCRVAEIYERRLADPRAALVTLQAALEQDPQSGRAVQEMERVARQNGVWAELVEITAEVANSLEDRKQAADLWVQIAFWNESGLGMLDTAAVAAGTALELAPDHGGALTLLEDLYRRQRNWDGYVAILAMKLEGPGADPYKLIDAHREVLRYEPRHGGALAALAGLYEQTAAWVDAADALSKLIPTLEGGEQLLGARHRLGRILKDHLRDVRGAEEQLALALAMPGGESHLPSMITLAGIYRDRKDWLKARQLLERASATASDPNERVRLLIEAAEICATQLDDENQAGQLYDDAIAIDPTRIDVVERLAALRFKRQDWAGLLPLAEFLVAKAEGPAATREPSDDRAPAAAPDLSEAGGETAAALVEGTAGDGAAGEGMAGEGAPVEGVAGKGAPVEGEAGEGAAAPKESPKRPAAERARLWFLLARALEETGDATRAEHAYLSSLDAMPEGEATFAVRRDYAAFCFRREAWADAAAAYQALLAGQAASLGRNETAELNERMGLAYLRAGAPSHALPALEKALTVDPRRQRVLEALLEAAKAAGDDDAIVKHTQALLAVTEDRDKKRELLEMVATIHRDRRHDPQRAIAAYRAALQDWPEERSIMHRLLELLTETKQWKQSVQLLGRLAELTEPDKRAPYYVAAGKILSEEVGAVSDAIEAFERALDADANDLKSFERIDRLVTASRDWKTQARSYRRQIKRMGPEVAPDKRPALLALWQGLGEIYRTRLKDFPSAIAAFEVAAGLDPGSLERHKILAELYRLNGTETYPKAVDELRAINQKAATVAEMVPNLKVMVRLFVEMGAGDEAHAVASVLALHGKADADERALYDQYRARGVVRAFGRLSEDLWQRLLYHPDEDRMLSQMLATLSPAIALARARAPRDIGLRRKQQRDINNDPSVVCKAFAYGSAVFGVPPPEIYFAPEAPGDLEVANIRGTASGMPALVIGKKLLDTQSDLEVAFIVGRTLAAVRPDHLLRWPSFVPTLAELEIALRAAFRLVDPARPVPADITIEVEKYATFLRRTMPPQLVEQLSLLVRRFEALHPEGDVLRTELTRWARGAYLTTLRGGLLLSGDLEVAARLSETSAFAIGLEPADVVRELCLFVVSAAYFELRTALGIRTVV
jgi:tetratricopeptide (TPR) repeat protein